MENYEQQKKISDFLKATYTDRDISKNEWALLEDYISYNSTQASQVKQYRERCDQFAKGLLGWILKNRFRPDLESGGWIRTFSHSPPARRTSEGILQLYKSQSPQT